jgi:hypothetical protein
LFDLFFSIDKFDADNDFGDQFRAVEAAPVFLGFDPQFEKPWSVSQFASLNL